jgi:aldehyde:ferredoxin oxidoreductase
MKGKQKHTKNNRNTKLRKSRGKMKTCKKKSAINIFFSNFKSVTNVVDRIIDNAADLITDNTTTESIPNCKEAHTGKNIHLGCKQCDSRYYLKGTYFSRYKQCAKCPVGCY